MACWRRAEWMERAFSRAAFSLSRAVMVAMRGERSVADRWETGSVCVCRWEAVVRFVGSGCGFWMRGLLRVRLEVEES